MVLTDVKWVREPDSLLKWLPLSHILKHWRWLCLGGLIELPFFCWGGIRRLSWCATSWPDINVWHDSCRGCIFPGGHILSFSFLSALFSTLHPLQLAELQLCTSQDQRLLLLAKSICVAIESLPNLFCLPPPPYPTLGPHSPKYTDSSIPTLSGVPTWHESDVQQAVDA